MRVSLSDGWVDLSEGQVVRGSELTPLTETERALFRFLAERTGRVVERRQLLREVWGYAGTSRTRTIDVTMRRLRAKVEPDPSKPVHLTTVVGRGYRFVPAATSHALVGRNTDLAQLDDCVGTGAKRVLLTGPGGVGKTSLARVWASRHGGSVVVELLGKVTRADVLAALRDALKLGGEPVVDDALRDALAARSAPVVLDNLDNADADALSTLSGLMEPLGSVVIGTCRHSGCLPGERVVRVQPLVESHATELLTHRLTEQGLTASSASLASLAKATDGLPLAIELAAARARTLGVDALVQYLPDPALLADATRRGTHRSLQTLIASSWEPLAPELKQALKQLATLSGAFSLARAEVLLGERVACVVAELCEASLVQRSPEPQAGRFRLLDTVQSYVRGRTTSDERAAVDAAWTAFADAHALDVGDEDPDLLALLHDSRMDLLAVFERATSGRGGLALVLYGALYYHDRLQTLLPVLDQAIDEETGQWRAQLLLYRGWVQRRLGHADKAIEDAMTVPSVPGCSRRVADEARLLIGQCRVYTEPERAAEELRALAMDGSVADMVRGMAWVGVGHAHRRTDALDDARSAYERANARLIDSAKRLRCAPLIGLGNLALARRDLVGAEEAYAQAAALAEQADDMHAVAVVSANQGVVLLSLHRFEEAAQALDKAAERHAFLGRSRSRMTALFAGGRAKWLAGDVEAARASLGTALALAERGGHAREMGWIGLTLAMVEAERGRLDVARRHADQVDGEPSLTALAQVALVCAEGDWEEAERLLTACRDDVESELEPEVAYFDRLIQAGLAR